MRKIKLDIDITTHIGDCGLSWCRSLSLSLSLVLVSFDLRLQDAVPIIYSGRTLLGFSLRTTGGIALLLVRHNTIICYLR